MANKIRVLLAEDHRTVREGVRLLLGSQPDVEVVGEAGDGRAALRMAKELAPDLVLMDVSMPELNGLKATELLREQCPGVRVLALTRHTDKAYMQQLLQAGAAGYVLKLSDPAVLLQAVPAATTSTRPSRARRSRATSAGRPGYISSRNARSKLSNAI
jgi:DNA-binding NarL/FixJ family response regulator